MTNLILPGLHGSGPDHWQSWWLSVDRDACLVKQDDWDTPRLDPWSGQVAAAVRSAPGAILIAHSLGCALVASIAVRHPALPIGGALLVAPADVEEAGWTSPGVAAFGPISLGQFPFPAIVVASRNDPYVTFERSARFSAAWGAELIDLGYAGHINPLSGFGPWPLGLRLAEGLKHRGGFGADRATHPSSGGIVTDALAFASAL